MEKFDKDSLKLNTGTRSLTLNRDTLSLLNEFMQTKENEEFGPLVRKRASNFLTEDEETVTKRFIRYVSKTTDALDKYADNNYKFLNRVDHPDGIKEHGVQYTVIRIIQLRLAYLLWDKDKLEDQTMKKVLDSLFPNGGQWVGDMFLDMETVQGLMWHLVDNGMRQGCSGCLKPLFDVSLKRACYDRLTNKILENKGITENTFVNMAVPQTDAELNAMINELIDRVWKRVDIMIMANLPNNVDQWKTRKKEESVKELKEQIGRAHV